MSFTSDNSRLGFLAAVQAMQARFCSPEHQALVAGWIAEEKAREFAAQTARVSGTLSLFPRKAQAAAARFGGPQGEADRSLAMRWLLEARQSEPWRQGRSALMWSTMGCGKSAAACACARLEALEGRSVRYLKAADASALEGERGRGLFDLCLSVAFLVLDQAHALRGMFPSSVETVRNLIDQRYDAERVTLILATLPAKDLLAVIGADVIDRTHPRLRWDGQQAGAVHLRWGGET